MVEAPRWNSNLKPGGGHHADVGVQAVLAFSQVSCRFWLSKDLELISIYMDYKEKGTAVNDIESNIDPAKIPRKKHQSS